MREDIGFHQNALCQPQKPIRGFSATCNECGSTNVEVYYEFNYYGGMTGWDSTLAIKCGECNNIAHLET